MRPALALATHRFIFRAAFAGANLFAWIFIFQYMFAQTGDTGVALARSTLLFALSQAILCLKTPYVLSRLRGGMKAGIILGTVFASAAFIFFAGAINNFFGNAQFLGVIGFAVFLGLYQAFYWIPYAVESQAYPSEDHSRDLTSMLIALMPALSGALLGLAVLEPSWLMVGAGIVILLSVIPLANIADVYEGFSWGYRETFSQLFAHENRRLLYTSLVQGIETAALLLLWPIALYSIFGYSYKMIGVIFSITLLLSIILRASMQALMRHYKVHNSPYVIATIAASAWLGRLLIISPISVVFVDSYFFAIPAGRNGASPKHFLHEGESFSYIDELTALKEMGLALGRIILCLIAAFFALSFSLPIAIITCFILAAIAAAIGVFLNRLPKTGLV